MSRIERGDGWELRLGDHREVLADVECHALISDPPYSSRTHKGIATGWDNSHNQRSECRPIVYEHWTPADVREFATSWSPRVSGWMACLTDSDLMNDFRAAFDDAGRYSFPPVPFVQIGKQARVLGDGPASWTCYLATARPREKRFMKWGSLPGAYVPPTSGQDLNHQVVKGGKPLWLMQNIVRDYSRPGQIVIDPCAGGATTLLAAVIEGRRAIGAECDASTFELAVKRLRRGHTRTFDFGGAA